MKIICNKKIRVIVICTAIIFGASLKSVSQPAYICTFLKNSRPGKKIVIDSSSSQVESYKIIISHLGTVKIKSAKIKIITWKKLWGINGHSSAAILLFGLNGNFLGGYPLGSGNDLPSKVINNNLIFENTNKITCDKKDLTIISFRSTIPKNIFLKCNGRLGDIYQLQNDCFIDN